MDDRDRPECSEHPSYKAVRKPQSYCWTCWAIYAYVNEADE